jgi:hypothetical protein
MAYSEPAFPFECEGDGGQSVTHTGMLLRDYFAAKAMAGLVERWSPSGIISSDEIARFAYALADAMLKAREGDFPSSEESASDA